MKVMGCRVAGGLGALLLATALVLVGGAGPAAAHTNFVQSFPEADATIVAPVTEVWLEFETPLVAEQSEVVVTGPDGSSKVVGEPTVTGNVIRVQVPPMTEVGDYEVSYRIVSLDGHLLDGDYGFSIEAGPAGQSTAAGSGAPASAAAGASRSGVGQSTIWWAGLWVALLAVTGSAFAAHRSQRNAQEREPVHSHR